MPAAPCAVELDIVALKAQRATCRKRSLATKRAEREARSESVCARRVGPEACKARAASALPGGRAGSWIPHGAVRAAVRTCINLGVVESTADIPCVSLGQHGRKPSVSPSVCRASNTSLELGPAEEIVLLDAHQASKAALAQWFQQEDLAAEAKCGDGVIDSEGSTCEDEDSSGCDAPDLAGAVEAQEVDSDGEGDSRRKRAEAKEDHDVEDGVCARESEGESGNGFDSAADTTATHDASKADAELVREQLRREVEGLLQEKQQLEAQFQAKKEEMAQVATEIKRKAVTEAVAIQKRAQDVASAQCNASADATEPSRPGMTPESKAALIKRGKYLQQQLSRQFRKQAQRERHLEQVRQRKLEHTHAIAAEELAKAQEEAADIMAEACALQARMREEARVAAAAEVHAAQAAAEAEARRILAEAEESARQLRDQVKALLDASSVSQQQSTLDQGAAQPEAEWELLSAGDEPAVLDGTEWALVC